MERYLCDSWGSTTVVSRGHAYDATRYSALLATRGGDIVGLATFRVAGDECQLLTLDALDKWQGIGSALLASVGEVAAERGCSRLWLITTNDNLDAIRFYQRRGMSLVRVHPGAVADARRIKPTIPHIGEYGIPCP
jgi:GNAT superfamily N-acetyltransferase